MILLFFVWYKKYIFWKWILWIPFLWISSTYLTGNSIIFRVTAQESYMSIKYQPWENKNNGNFTVSIHRIPFIVYLTIRVISCIFRFKRGLLCCQFHDLRPSHCLVGFPTCPTKDLPGRLFHPNLGTDSHGFTSHKRCDWKLPQIEIIPNPTAKL